MSPAITTIPASKTYATRRNERFSNKNSVFVTLNGANGGRITRNAMRIGLGRGIEESNIQTLCKDHDGAIPIRPREKMALGPK